MPNGTVMAVHRRVARIFVRGNTTMEGPKVPSEARRRESPERRGGWGLGRGYPVAPPQYGLCPRKFSKNQRWNCTFSFGFSNVWRVTPVAKQPSVCNSGAKIFFSIHDGGTFTHVPPLATPLAVHIGLHTPTTNTDGLLTAMASSQAQ